MTDMPSDAWFSVFPPPHIPTVLAYVGQTWHWLRSTHAAAVGFDRDEPTLTDNLCEALADPDRRFTHRMDCDFQSETWELRRGADGSVHRLARADIRVILGAPGSPHLVLEFKKLDGSTGARWRYCHDGLNRFVEGKYAVGHAFGAMCAFTCMPVASEAGAMALYVAEPARASALSCKANANNQFVTTPSQADPAVAAFDTHHDRPTQQQSDPITILHIFLPC